MNQLSHETFELRLKTIDIVEKLLRDAEFRYEKDALRYLVSKALQAKNVKNLIVFRINNQEYC